MKKKCFVFLVIGLLASCLKIEAKVETGKTYRIESVAKEGYSLLTKNSSLDANAEVVLWAETDVASQQWTLAIASTMMVARNTYSSKALGVPSSAAGAKTQQIGSSGVGRWKLEAVDEDNNVYRIKSGSTSLYLTIDANATNGTVPSLATSKADATQEWRFVEVEPKNTFTRTMREEMMDDYVSKTVETKGSSRRTFGGGGWGESEQLEVVLDAYETTGRADYLQLARDVYNWFYQNVGTTWSKLVYTDNYHWYGHDFNDDVMWQIIAIARLGLLSGNDRYVQQAKRNFDVIYDRAYIPFTGLMRWAESTGDPYGTNSCIAGPTEVAACYLGFAGCGEEYFEKARQLYTAQRYVLANNLSTGKVDDSVVWNPETQKVKSRNNWGSTYNQGTMLGAACMLYKYYGDEQYLEDAKKIMRWTRNNLCDSHGIINACQVKDGDLAGFKGILMRYVRRFVRDLGQSEYATWLEDNALHAYCNRSTEGVTPTAWLQKGATDNTNDDFGLSTAASAAVNVSFPDDPALPYQENPKQTDAIGVIKDNGEQSANAIKESGQMFDLAGRKIATTASVRGIYVISGKKKAL